jgi:Large polyvalent protein-associated domain 1
VSADAIETGALNAAQLSLGLDAATPAPDEDLVEAPAADAQLPELTFDDQEDAKTKLVDVGEKIGGARKDVWASRGLRLGDLDGMTGAEEAKYVTKQNVWTPDYAAMVTAGVDRQAVALLKLGYDRIAARPRQDTPDERRRFLGAMELIRDAYSGVRTEADLKAAYEGLRDVAKARQVELYSLRPVHRRYFSLGFGYGDVDKAKRLVAQGFPDSIEPWSQHFVIVPYGQARFILRSRGKDRRWLGDYKTREEALEAARAAYEKRQDERTEEDKLPSRPHLDQLKRGGPDYRGHGRDVAGEDLLSEFGFRGIEFGNWTAQDERQKMLNLAYDALSDLADVVGVPRRALALGGTLGLAFGARGSGRASAHYEPGKLVINLTKIRGAGALAHEWGHALDHYFGELDRRNAYQGAARYAAATGAGRDVVGAGSFPHLRQEMSEAWPRVVNALFSRVQTREELVAAAESALKKATTRLAEVDAQMAAIAKLPADSPQQRHGRDLRQWRDEHGARAVGIAERRLDAVLTGEAPPRRVPSSYYEQAQKLCGETGAKGYWSRPTELLARAFEAYVFDRLAEQGRQDDYLVHGVEPGRFGQGYKGDPYPAGDERVELATAFGSLFSEMRTRETEKGLGLYEVRDVNQLAPCPVFLPELIRERFSGLAQIAEERGDLRVRFGDGRGDLLFRVRVGTIEFEPTNVHPDLAVTETVTGRMRSITGAALIDLRAGAANAQTLGHEELHALLALGRLTRNEVDDLWRQHGYAPRPGADAAERLEHFREIEERVAETVGALIAERLSGGRPTQSPAWFEKVWAVLVRVWNCLRWPEAERVKARIVSGDVYRDPAPAAEGVRTSPRRPEPVRDLVATLPALAVGGHARTR